MNNEIFYKNLGKNIKLQRKVLNLTQQELADKVNIGINHMGKIEIGFSKPSLDLVIELANALDITVSELCKINH